ncbi:GntR family transcriptional regulator [Streptomyces althioticus]|jgi:DNA-binding GntR family transcriptional regulator|uniref:GntR family transcriptional regulator n=2 Tax=Streptomyces TaxID=1883 RepID=A0ABP6U351_9ACTN|nr:MULTISPECIES: GntR family transcriptional regulator [Actinomycetes]ALV52112.1 GntR family transcriptional regulator [Streptomyces sp. 4F]MCC9688149.1 GntR family transcriptional regulator [Streptomyces sp. MNU103]MXQ57640.1 UTRA domain-containing protein [Streptomyces sp. XHT-2]PWE09316.1 GntR family transcriptional regulator [Streptomyces sp. BSE7F]WSB47823.1 GntR family transcriptional regulator [Streptomyces cellulosae]WTC23184.1 GntR family transcriptional regulator [Streptomyces althi
MSEQADNRAPYAQIAAHYAELITSGELVPGSLLPSIKNLAQEWKVSTATAEKALRKLRTEGLVRGIHGIGTEVLDRPSPMSSGSQRQDRGRRSGSSWGSGERSDSHQAAVVPAPADVAGALDIAPGSEVIRRRRVYRDRHGIVAHSTSWIPVRYGRLIPQLMESDRLTGGTSLQLIAQATGHPITHRIDTASARLLTPEDARLLELDPAHPPADPVVVMTAKFVDSESNVVEYGVDLGGPGRTWRTESEVTP